MAYQSDKGDIVITGYESGISPSPHKGIANIQNGNISTETGEVMASFGRTLSTMTDTSTVGTFLFADSSHIFVNIPGSNGKLKGMWVVISNSTHTGELDNGTYWCQLSTGAGEIQLSTTYQGSVITGYTSGLSGNIVLLRTTGQALGYAVEPYFSGGSQYFRYYVLDNQGLVWVYDSINDVTPTSDQQYWFLPDASISYWGSDAAPSGLLVLNGNLLVFSGNRIWTKPTVNLGTYQQMTNAVLMSQSSSKNPHFGFTGHQGRGYYTDGSYIGSIFPNTSLLSKKENVQSYSSWFASAATTGTITDVISGTIPSVGPNVGQTGFSGIPAVFFPATGGTLPSSMSANTVYYIAYSTANGTFQVYDTLAHANAGGATGLLNLQTGATGVQYFNTFWVIGTHAGAYGDTSTMTFSPQRLALPSSEVAQCMCEVSNNIIIGARSSVVYPWNQVDALPGSLINLPEADVKQIINVNQMAYMFAGYKGNIYITDGSVASLVIKVPDYCAGIPGTPTSYIEPMYTWGGAAYIRGRVYFSVLDQTLFTQSITQLKAGNCGGIWSFVPTQNLYIGQDTGIALRLENQSSYGTYNGYVTVIVPLADQSQHLAPQFWSCWQDTIVPSPTPNYGFDFTSASPTSNVIIETDLIPVGTVLNKYTPKQLEYKLSTPLTAGESVSVAWRKDSTSAWTDAGTLIQPDGALSLSGYYTANLQGAQWIQLQYTLIPAKNNGTSWTRFTQGIIR